MFKFQSDWPENSPKPYIYHYLIQLLENNKVKGILPTKVATKLCTIVKTVLS